jgi:nucleoside-diphosphate-sugar epimerase
VTDIAKVLVTGCAGFIGSNLVEELLKLGYSVSGVDDLSTGRSENTKGLDFEFHKGTINDKALMMKILKGVDFVMHQAAIPSVPRSISDPIESNHANVDGTLNLLVCARDSDVKRLVFASSSSVYGSSPELPKKEGTPSAPISPYALTKHVGEVYCKLFFDIYGLETISLRYFNVFGPRQNPDSQYAAVVPKFIKMMLRSKSPPIFGDGEQTRDFSYVANVLDANILALKAPKKACGPAYNIACGEKISVNRLVEEINSILGTGIKPRYAKERPGDIKHSLADITLAKKWLGYKPSIKFREGLAKTVEWHKNSG